MSQYFKHLTNKQIWVYSLLLGIGIEVVTILLRFGLGLQSTRDTGFMARFTLEFRIHHGYLGVLLIFLAFIFPTRWKNLLLIIGIALTVSDITHHFLILWPLTGSPHFDLRYLVN